MAAVLALRRTARFFAGGTGSSTLRAIVDAATADRERFAAAIELTVAR
jgi:hypothetical protein